MNGFKHFSFALLLVLAFWHSSLAARIDTLKVWSAAMQLSISNLVIVPNGYESNQSGFYPVVYLLHGAGDDYTTWLREVPGIRLLADQYNILIVCPDGGNTSWYFDSPIDSTMRYETYITRELLPAVEKKYRVFASRNGRAITGQSMGGHGAFYLAFRHPDLWGAAGSMSGGLDIRPFPHSWDLPGRLGDYHTGKDVWEQHTVINLIGLLEGVKMGLIIDVGLADFFLEVNRQMHKALLQNGIPHDYIERPGNHSWAYWRNAVKYQFLYFAEFFARHRNGTTDR